MSHNLLNIQYYTQDEAYYCWEAPDAVDVHDAPAWRPKPKQEVWVGFLSFLESLAQPVSVSYKP